MKTVKQSIAIILFLLLACLADSFGQNKTFKQELKRKNSETGNYELIKTDYSPYEIEFLIDKNTVLFAGKSTNRFIINKVILDKVINGYDTQFFKGYWDLIGNNCNLVITRSDSLMLLSIYYELNGNEYSLIYFVRISQ